MHLTYEDLILDFINVFGMVLDNKARLIVRYCSKLKDLLKNLASFKMMTEWVDAADVPPTHAFIAEF